MSGYYDVSVIVDGALDEERKVRSDRALATFATKVEAEHAQIEDAGVWEIYALWHDHASGVECECVQYAQDHHAYATFGVES